MPKRKFLFLAFCALVPAIALSSVASATLVTNGDFEDGETGWFKWGSNAWVVSDSGPVDYFKDTASAALYWSDSGWVQVISGVSEGESFDLSGEMIHPSGTPLAGTRSAYLKLEFWDAGDTTLIAEHEVGVMDRFDADDTWHSYSGTGYVAPAGTGIAKVVLLTYDSGPNPTPSGTAYFDNVVLTPEPSTVALLGLGSLALLRRRRH